MRSMQHGLSLQQRSGVLIPRNAGQKYWVHCVLVFKKNSQNTDRYCEIYAPLIHNRCATRPLADKVVKMPIFPNRWFGIKAKHGSSWTRHSLNWFLGSRNTSQS